MAVPKKKTSPSRRGMRNSHSALKPISCAVIDKKTGEYYRRHHIAKDGTYNGKTIIVKKAKDKQSDEKTGE